MTARRNHCPQGRPLFRPGETPARLATMTRLRAMRLRLALGQMPVATLLYGGRRYAPLFEVSEAVPLPPLPPGRAAAYDAARTCVRCLSIVAGSALPRFGVRRRRLCPPCLALEHEAMRQAGRNAARADAVAWARAVWMDPSVALVAVGEPRPTGEIELCADAPGGDVGGPVGGPQLVTLLPDAATSSPTDAGLAGRRLVVFVLGSSSAWLRWAAATGTWPQSRMWASDHFAPRYNTWLGRDGLGHTTTCDARLLVDQMNRALQAMAADDHPDGPARCPALPETGAVACGAPVGLGTAGWCPDHQPARPR